VVHIDRNFISHAGVKAVGIFYGRTNRGLDPAAVAAVAGVVGKPDAMDGPDDIVIYIAVHFVGPEQGANSPGILIQGPVVGNAEFKGVPRFGVNLNEVLEGLGNALFF
jgi:hypothetical protein